MSHNNSISGQSINKQLSNSLKEDSSDNNRKKWTQHIIKNEISLIDLVELLDHEKFVSMRFIWMVGDLCEQKPEIVYPAIPYFYSRLNDVKFPNYDRSLAKMFWLCGIPDEIEGEAIDVMFKWILDPKITVSTKSYSLSALMKVTLKYPELKNELKIVILDQFNKNTTSFEKRATRVLEELENR